MCEARTRKYVRQLGGKPCIRIGIIIHIELRLLNRGCCHKDCHISALVIAEWDESELRQLGFTPVGNSDFGWALQDDLILVGSEGVNREPVYQTAAFDATNRGTPPIPGEGVRQTRGKAIRCVSPKVGGVIGYEFSVIELLDD